MTTELQAAAAELELKDYDDLGEALEECQKMLEAERAKVKELEEQNARLGYRVKRLREALSHYHEGYIARQALREMAELDAARNERR